MKIQLFERRSRGFTLIEMMVVLVVIGILAAAIISQFIGTTKDTKVSAPWKRRRGRNRNGAVPTSRRCATIPGAAPTSTALPGYTSRPVSTFGPKERIRRTAAKGIMRILGIGKRLWRTSKHQHPSSREAPSAQAPMCGVWVIRLRKFELGV